MRRKRIDKAVWRTPFIVAVCAGLAFAAGWFANSSFYGDFRTYDLGNGRQIILLRNIEEAYPVYGKTVKAALDLALDQKQELLKSTTGGKYETGVQKLYENLDAINADVRTTLIAAYSALVLRVSSSKEPSELAAAFQKWDEVLALVIQEAARVRKLDQQLAAVKTVTSSGEWEKLFSLGQEAAQSAADLKTRASTP